MTCCFCLSGAAFHLAFPCRTASAVEPPDAQTYDSTVRGIAFSPDGCYFLAGSDDKLAQVWSTKTWELLNTWQVPCCHIAAKSTLGCSACAMPTLRRFLGACPCTAVSAWHLLPLCPLTVSQSSEALPVQRSSLGSGRTGSCFAGQSLLCEASSDSAANFKHLGRKHAPWCCWNSPAPRRASVAASAFSHLLQAHAQEDQHRHLHSR